MGVTTTADELRDKARENVKEAISTLLEFLKEDTWGYHEYSEDYKDEIHLVISLLMQAKRKIG